MIIDPKGTIVFMENGLVAETRAADLLERVSLKRAAKTVAYGGTRYAEKTAKNNRTAKRALESSPCLRTGKNNRLHLVYTLTQEEGCEIRLRILEPEKPADAEEILISENGVDAYFADAVLDEKDNLWIFYTGLAESGFYDIFVRCRTVAGDLSRAINLSRSDDDAMHPAGAFDRAGNLWITYYAWRKMGSASRDKEVFARMLKVDFLAKLEVDGVDAVTESDWYKSMQLSPQDLPAYEDHTDPVIIRKPSGGVRVAWSWDMHPLEDPRYKRFQTQYGADAPTIFGRDLTAGKGVGDLLFLGEAGIDNAPELYLTAGGSVWCAWHSLNYQGRKRVKGLYTSVSTAEEPQRCRQLPVEEGVRDICSPRFIERGGTLYLLWSSQTDRGSWCLKRSAFQKDRWSKPTVVIKKGDPRFCSLARDADGGVWVAQVRDDGANRRIACEKLGF